MKKGQINTIIFVLVLIFGIALNIFRFFPNSGVKKPSFEIFDVRMFNDLDPVTIVHYQIRNVGKTEAYEVLTSVSYAGGNESPPAFFANISVGKAVSANRNIPLGRYTELKIGIIHRENRKVNFYTVVPDIKPDPPPTPDFIVYNLTLRSTSDDAMSKNRSIFWIMNIGGSTAHNVNVSLEGGLSTLIPSIQKGESIRVSIEQHTITWEGVDIEIICSEGVRQVYHLIDYN